MPQGTTPTSDSSPSSNLKGEQQQHSNGFIKGPGKKYFLNQNQEKQSIGRVLAAQKKTICWKNSAESSSICRREKRSKIWTGNLHQDSISLLPLRAFYCSPAPYLTAQTDLEYRHGFDKKCDKDSHFSLHFIYLFQWTDPEKIGLLGSPKLSPD
ncbi:uncharacterized protein [Narcine bancroftii]|uniref:uncharacterized protein isoform X1 n=1 Tax=Narcine bancroftii TaxID=1343680 RepID=UPI003831347C